MKVEIKQKFKNHLKLLAQLQYQIRTTISKMEAPEQEISCQALEVSDKSVEQDLNDEKKEENIVV